MAKEHDKARAWREKQELTVANLAGLTGYSRYAIYLFEKGVTAETSERDAGKIDPAVWRRYKLICGGLDAERRSKRAFNW